MGAGVISPLLHGFVGVFLHGFVGDFPLFVRVMLVTSPFLLREVGPQVQARRTEPSHVARLEAPGAEAHRGHAHGPRRSGRRVSGSRGVPVRVKTDPGAKCG